MKVSPARAAAFDALCRVERDAAFATDALDARLEGLSNRADAALATELTLGVLRWQRLLDFLLARHTERGVSSLDLEVRLALRLGLYQLRFLSRVPARAAVNDSVELVKRARKSSAAALVNAVLRRAASGAHLRGAAETLLPGGLSVAERLGIALSHPTWLVERWLPRFGEGATRAILEANNRPPRLCAALLSGENDAAVRSALAEHGFQCGPGRWLKTAIELRAMPRARKTRLRTAIETGLFVVQDEASQMIPYLADTRPGHHVLDLCAAPGGKTARLAQLARPGTVLAADLHVHRLRPMRAFLERAGAPNVQLLALDGTRDLPFASWFDRVVVDAPCSGTGTLARNPEIRWRLRPEDLPALAAKQTALLRQGLAHLAPTGRLVYSTCSLEPEENEEVVGRIIAGARARVEREEGTLAAHLAPGRITAELFDTRGYFRTLPGRDGTDGFFGAVIVPAAPQAR